MNEVQPTIPPPPIVVTEISGNRDENANKLQWITYFSSFVVIAVAAAYLIGFVVVNSSLFKYGMVPYDFLQPRYVSAGLLYLTSTVGFTSMILMLLYLIKQKHFLGDIANSEIKSGWLIIFVFLGSHTVLGPLLPTSQNNDEWVKTMQYPALVLALFISCLATSILPLPDRLTRFNCWWRRYMWEGGWLSYIILLLMLIHTCATLGLSFAFYPAFLCSLWLFISGFRQGHDKNEVVHQNANAMVYGISTFCFSIYLYGSLTYPLISPHIGGGKPLLISLAVKPEHRRTIGRILGREDWKCVMHNISLIHENSELMYVLPKGYLSNEAAIAIPKNEIVSIAYQRNAKIEHATCYE
jgi:hypothetical protein